MLALADLKIITEKDKAARLVDDNFLAAYRYESVHKDITESEEFIKRGTTSDRKLICVQKLL